MTFFIYLLWTPRAVDGVSYTAGEILRSRFYPWNYEVLAHYFGLGPHSPRCGEKKWSTCWQEVA